MATSNFRPFPLKLFGFATSVGAVLLFVSNSERMFKYITKPAEGLIFQIDLEKAAKAKLKH